MEPAADTRSRACTPAEPGYASTFPGLAEQISQVRREITAYLAGCPAADDIILIASELATNAVIHTRSRGATFVVRCQLSARTGRIEVQDLGGPWRPRPPGDRPHGLDIIQALTGQDDWGIKVTGTGGRIVWARLAW
jgi:serine/threonine-protein kinase RsbW